MANLKRFFTGIQSTGTITLGNYCGIIQPILELQKKGTHEIIVAIVDLHSLTVPKKDFDYAQKGREMAALLYACGLNQNCKIFIQSQVKEHLELAWLLAPFVTISELNNMIQYKEKKKEQETGNLALLSYPVLMAADIFIYEVDLVIVGQDQQQHIELAQHIAQKFNNFYDKKLLKTPTFEIPPLGGKIMGLKNPTKKMSKSENDYIGLLDVPEVVKAKFKKAQTDSDEKNAIYYDLKDENKKWVANLLTICALLQDKEISEVEKKMNKLNYSDFKNKVAEIVNEKLSLIQQKYHQLLPHIGKTLTQNSNYLRNLAEQKMNQIKKELKLL